MLLPFHHVLEVGSLLIFRPGFMTFFFPFTKGGLPLAFPFTKGALFMAGLDLMALGCVLPFYNELL